MRSLLVACLLAFSGGIGASAQQLDNPVIGIVDVQRVLQDAKAAKSVLPEFEKLRKTFQQQVKDQEKTLRDAEQQLSQQRAILSREAFTEKRRAFTEQAAAIQAQVQERRRELDESFNATKNVILQNLVQVAQEVAKSKNLNIVMEKRFVFISAKSLDITDDILASLDKRLPVVSIQVPKNNKTQGGAKGQR
ncbi:MAG: OmpH family outer membrane protein [Leptospirales bacterium]